jgi:hypothetical protein
MKTRFKVPILAFVVGLVFTLGVCLAPVLEKHRSARASDYLPDIPPIAGVSVINQETTGSNHFAARHFVFRASDSSGIKNCSDVMMRIEASLQTSGWEKIQGNASSAVASTAWHHKDKWGWRTSSSLFDCATECKCTGILRNYRSISFLPHATLMDG